MRTLHKILRWFAWDFWLPLVNLSSFVICCDVVEFTLFWQNIKIRNLWKSARTIWKKWTTFQNTKGAGPSEARSPMQLHRLKGRPWQWERHFICGTKGESRNSQCIRWPLSRAMIRHKTASDIRSRALPLEPPFSCCPCHSCNRLR